MSDLSPDQLLKLYEIETLQVHSSVDHVLKIRGIMSLAFTAIFEATLIYKEGVLALAALIFIAAWCWDYIYARYQSDYVSRVDQLRKQLGQLTNQSADLSEALKKAYDHRLLARLAQHVGKWREGRGKKKPLLEEGKRIFLITFFDFPRAITYLAMSLAPLWLASFLGFPWVRP
jgi:hypothetical protein